MKSTINPIKSTINPIISTINPIKSTINPIKSTINPIKNSDFHYITPRESHRASPPLRVHVARHRGASTGPPSPFRLRRLRGSRPVKLRNSQRNTGASPGLTMENGGFLALYAC